MGDRHCEPMRRVWWLAREGRFKVEVRYGARIVATEYGYGPTEAATALARELAEKHKAAEIREGD